MNKRLLSYNMIEDLGFMVVHETTYKGQRIRRQRGKDQHGTMNNTTFIWKGIRFKKLSVIIELIDNQTK
jgi:hypothetical protein